LHATPYHARKRAYTCAQKSELYYSVKNTDNLFVKIRWDSRPLIDTVQNHVYYSID